MRQLQRDLPPLRLCGCRPFDRPRDHPPGRVGQRSPRVFVASIIVSSLLALACLASGMAKVTRQPALVAQLGGLGVAATYVPVLGALLVLGAAGLVLGNWVGALGVAAAGALALYFLGAILTHLRAGDAKGSVPTVALALASVAALVLRVLSL